MSNISILYMHLVIWRVQLHLYSAPKSKGIDMALIKVTCFSCGDVELSSDQVIISSCEATNESVYSFFCSTCGLLAVRHTPPNVVDILLAAGCPKRIWKMPDELLDPKRSDIVPAITHDDVLDFHQALASILDCEIASAAQHNI